MIVPMTQNITKTAVNAAGFALRPTPKIAQSWGKQLSEDMKIRLPAKSNKSSSVRGKP